ncbi:MAG TPA: choice-of-anchor tandem repeat GloVer-containing protein [Terriglobales bacterium]|nr:choice-of-anchor tandem repeat GloVer-containing protein [Terriglobales bacterium]
MTHTINSRFTTRWLVPFVAVLVLTSTASAGWKEKVLYSFQGGSDGQDPAGGVVFDSLGNLYGATQEGGADNCSPVAACGTVYQLAPSAKNGGSWTETVLHVFQGKAVDDGDFPRGGIIADAVGNIYGTTGYGGTGDCVLLGIKGGCGTIFEMSPPQRKDGAWTYTILYSFKGGKDGNVPFGDLVFDGAGNLYGSTEFGGGKGTTCDPDYYQYCGTVFKLSPPKTKGGKWTEQVLHSFAGGSDGGNPNGGLVLDSAGAIYGTTVAGGNQGCMTNYSVGCGIVFELRPPTVKSGTWAEKRVKVFTGGNDGGVPNGGLIFDAKGALYGTAGGGAQQDGVVYQLTHNSAGAWVEAVVHTFIDNVHGRDPVGPVTLDSAGNLIGSALWGQYFRGLVYRLEPPKNGGGTWSYAIPYEFKGAPAAAYPEARLIFDNTGNIYSTTIGGGAGSCSGGCGTVFELQK